MNGRTGPAVPHTDLTALLIVGIGGLVLSLSAFLWLGAGLTSLLSGRGWPQAPLSGAVGFAIGVAQGTSPPEAWAHTYPDAGGFGPTGMFWILLMALFSAGTTLALLLLPRFVGRSTARSQPAHWATRRQQARIAVPNDQAKRRWRLVA